MPSVSDGPDVHVFSLLAELNFPQQWRGILIILPDQSLAHPALDAYCKRLSSLTCSYRFMPHQGVKVMMHKSFFADPFSWLISLDIINESQLRRCSRRNINIADHEHQDWFLQGLSKRLWTLNIHRKHEFLCRTFLEDPIAAESESETPVPPSDSVKRVLQPFRELTIKKGRLRR
ncbi:MAG: uncharacterized protein KVP18_002877 [Porospora cf. gigantea A]|uniref:uncharacterized protein n=2 Tax=Porospora cf. gigantea A TaxID=2853593 RepID=UPI003559DBF3|nr:MAG: hypothetical protein KVP18_002877 [Porospora cf. gigantea A]